MKAEITDFYHDRGSLSYRGEVVFAKDALTVSFKDENLKTGVTYKGEEVGPDRWLLKCPQVKGKASLSRSPIDPNCLEGQFIHDGGKGMWMIDVEDNDDGE